MTPQQIRDRKFNVMKNRSHPAQPDYAQERHIEAMREVTEAQTASNVKFQFNALANAVKQTEIFAAIAKVLVPPAASNATTAAPGIDPIAETLIRAGHTESEAIQMAADSRARLAATAAPGDLPELYEGIGKGGVYEFIGCSNGAGEKRGETIVVYRETSRPDVFYHRSMKDFDTRMRRLAAAPSNPPVGAKEQDK